MSLENGPGQRESKLRPRPSPTRAAVHGWPRACQVRNRRQEALGRRLTSRWKSQLRPRRRRRGDAEGQSERRWGRFSCAPSCGAAAGRGFNGEAVMQAQPTKCCNALPSCDAGRGNLPGSGSRPRPRWLGLFSAAGNRASPSDLLGTIQAALCGGDGGGGVAAGRKRGGGGGSPASQLLRRPRLQRCFAALHVTCRLGLATPSWNQRRWRPDFARS